MSHRYYDVTVNGDHQFSASSFTAVKQLVTLRHLTITGAVVAQVHSHGSLVAEYDGEAWTIHDETILPAPVRLAPRQREVLRQFRPGDCHRPDDRRDVEIARRLNDLGLLMGVGVDGQPMRWTLTLLGERTLAHLVANSTDEEDAA